MMRPSKCEAQARFRSCLIPDNRGRRWGRILTPRILQRGADMEYVIGLTLAAAVAWFATAVGLARERSFYATVLIIVGSYYVLFAAMGASRRTLVAEIVVAGIFVLFAVLGFKGNLWLLAVGLVGHG